MSIKEKLLNSTAEFSWSFGQEFFLETSFGNFVWSDPDYDGDNTVRRFDGDITDWIHHNRLPFVRCKGTHFISGYVGEDFIYVEE